jgi:hypothetical protein
LKINAQVPSSGPEFAFWVNFVMYSKWQSSIGRFTQSGDDHLYEDLANFGYKQHMKVLNILLF